MSKIPLQLRFGQSTDLNFIYNSWLKSVADTFFAHGMPKKIYYDLHAEVIKDLLECSRVIVAVNPEDSEHIFGFIVYHPDYQHNRLILHFVYVKQPYRQLGVANKLKQAMLDHESEHLSEPSLIATQTASTARNVKGNMLFDLNNFLKVKWNYTFNPYLLWKVDLWKSQRFMLEQPSHLGQSA